MVCIKNNNIHLFLADLVTLSTNQREAAKDWAPRLGGTTAELFSVDLTTSVFRFESIIAAGNYNCAIGKDFYYCHLLLQNTLKKQ